MTVYANGPELEKISHEAMEWVNNFKIPTSRWAKIIVLAGHPSDCMCPECYEASKDELRDAGILPKKQLTPEQIDDLVAGYQKPEN